MNALALWDDERWQWRAIAFLPISVELQITGIGTECMMDASSTDRSDDSLCRAMKSAIELLSPRAVPGAARQRVHYTREAIAEKLKLGKEHDLKAKDKPRAHALRDFLNEKRATRRLSPVWIDFAYEIRKMLFDESQQSDAIRAELVTFSAILENYLLGFHEFHASHFLVPPKVGAESYKFRIPKYEAELIPFVKFSDAEPDITAANPGLKGERRFSLYKEWFAVRRDSFLILDRVNPMTGNAGPIAVSIVLPLSSEGERRIIAGNLKTVFRKPDGSFSSELLEFIVKGNESIHALLLDTWIVRKQNRQRNTVNHVSGAARESHQKWGNGLLMKHISIFTESAGPKPIFIEPDYWHIRHLCRIWSFEDVQDEQLWIVPPDKDRSGVLQLLWGGVTEAANWDVTK